MVTAQVQPKKISSSSGSASGGNHRWTRIDTDFFAISYGCTIRVYWCAPACNAVALRAGPWLIVFDTNDDVFVPE